MVEREAQEDFDYLFDEGGTPSDADAFDPESAPGADMSFDAFDTNTWYFEPAPPPWYRTKQILAVLTVATVAVVALVVAGVLVVFRGSGTAAVDESTSTAPTAAPSTAPSTVPSTAPSRTAVATSAAPPPPPPPPAEPSAPPVAPPPAPAQTVRPPSPPAPPEQTAKKPEIGVTRTPVTRSPISVAPRRPGSSQG